MPVEMHRNSPVIVFGEGDIAVAAYGKAGTTQGGVRLTAIETAEVGSDLPPDEVGAIDPLVILHFMSVESLDVVMDGLKVIRELMTTQPSGEDA